MLRPAPALARAVALLLASFLPASAQEPRPVTPGTGYPPGTVVTSPLTGVTFRLPSDLGAEWDPDVRGLVGLGQDVLAGIWAWSEGTAEEVAEEVGAILEAQGIQLVPRGEVETSDDELRGDFDATTPEGAAALHAVVREGPRGGVVAIAALGAPDGAARTREVVDEVVASLRWSTPGAASWRGEVSGAVLSWSGGGSDISTGTTTATGASESRATLALCAGGYRYEESSESYVSIMGASASSSSSDAHAGQWWLVADLAGGATLLLDATDGRSFRWSVEEAGDAYLVDGYRYVLTGSC